MPSPLTLIGQAWRFYQKQPALFPVLVWMLIIPSVITNMLNMRLLKDGDTIEWASNETVLLILGIVLCWVVFTWGMASVLVIGKRLLQHKAGRTRTSFKAVRTQAGKALIPLILTSILRDCYTFLWALLLIVPGIIYSFRTVFFSIIIICEGKAYQEALSASKEVVMGRTLHVALMAIALTLPLQIPSALIEQIAHQIIPKTDLLPWALVSIFSSGLSSMAAMITTLTMVLLYGSLKTGELQEDSEDTDDDR